MMRCAIALLAPLLATAQSFEGDWHAQSGDVVLEIHIVKSRRGYTGELRNIEYPDRVVPLAGIVARKNTIRFETPAVRATFDGVFKDADSIDGEWTQAGSRSELQFVKGKWTPALEEGRPVPLSLDIEVRTPPTAAPAGGAYYLGYELHLNNFGSRSVEINRVEVWSAEKLAALQGESLTTAMRIGPAVIEGGKRAVVMLWVKTDRPPASLRHKVRVKAARSGEEVEVTGGETEVGQNPVVLSPPLKGANWKAFGGPSADSYHRTAMGVFEGRFTCAQRFAIDFARIGADGKPFTGSGLANQDHHAWGAEVLAVADGVVAVASDGARDIAPTLDGRRLDPPDIATAAGNWVALEIAPGRYAHYAHLQSGTVRVKAGDRVTRGQVIGLVGNSGHTTGPHLHFHVSDGAAALASDGVPYVIESFWGDGVAHVKEMPLRDWLLRFP